MARVNNLTFGGERYSILGSNLHPCLRYKERLHTKVLKESKGKCITCDSLSGQNWRFLKNGLDDYRDGFPPIQPDGFFIQRSKGPRPVLCNTPGSFKSFDKKMQNKLTKDQLCFSKMNPLKQTRREYTAEIEYSLSKHPLALYPHLEEGMHPELFEEVVDVLDPEMHLNGDLASILEIVNGEQDSGEHTVKKTEIEPYVQTKGSIRQSAISSESKHKNPYKWLPKKDNCRKEDRTSKLKQTTSPSLDERIRQVTKEFCDWVASLPVTDQYFLEPGAHPESRERSMGHVRRPNPVMTRSMSRGKM